jgi:lipoprotein-anchoring transpeptidase ErfK/SrfK
MTLRTRVMGLLSRGLLGVLLLGVALVPQGQAIGQSDSSDENGDHILQPGETDLDLELFYNITKPDIDALNNEQNLSLAQAGQSISVAVAVTAPIVSQPPAEPGVGGPYPGGVQPAAPAAQPPQAAAPTTAPVVAPAQPADPPGAYTVQRGDTLFRIATQYGLPLWALASANGIANPDTIYVGQQLNVAIDPSQVKPLPTATPAPPVTQQQVYAAPPAPDTSGKRILVVLHEEMVYVYQDGVLLRQFLSSTGLPGTPTVQGTFSIYVKYDAQRMVGPGYDLPGVPWVMYFYRGYALHGTYWHNNFGHPMSHGCVNLRTPEAEWLYEWAPVGTTVTVVG